MNNSKIAIACVIFAIIAILIFNSSKNNKIKSDLLAVNEANFQKEVLESDRKVLIDFYADWCGPCQALSPLIEEVAKETPNVKFVRINIDDNVKLSDNYNIFSIPTLVVVENGEEIKRVVGYIEKDEIKRLIK